MKTHVKKISTIFIGVFFVVVQTQFCFAQNGNARQNLAKDYLIRLFNDNVPYTDENVQKMLSVLSEKDKEEVTATYLTRIFKEGVSWTDENVKAALKNCSENDRKRFTTDFLIRDEFYANSVEMQELLAGGAYTKEEKEDILNFSEIVSLTEKHRVNVLRNKEALKEKATRLTPLQREYTYEKAKPNIGGTIVGNYTSGFGLGSFLQRDIIGGLACCAAIPVGALIGAGIGSEMSSSDSDSVSKTVNIIEGSFFGEFFLTRLVGIAAPIIFASRYNKVMQDIVNVDSDGNALPEVKNQSYSPSLSVLPLVNPVNNNYGLVALINF